MKQLLPPLEDHTPPREGRGGGGEASCGAGAGGGAPQTQLSSCPRCGSRAWQARATGGNESSPAPWWPGTEDFPAAEKTAPGAGAPSPAGGASTFPGPLGLLHTADLRGLLVSKQSIHLSPENRAAPPVLREGRQPRGSCTLAQRPLRGGRGQGSAGPWRTHVCLSLSREAGKGGQEWCSGNVRQRPLDSTWGSLPYPCPGSAGRRWAGPEPHAVPAGAQPC